MLTILMVLSLTNSLVLDIIKEEEIIWAFDYIEKHIEDVEQPVTYPNGIVYSFPDDEYEGFSIRKTGAVDWYKEPVPLGGTILVRKDWVFGSILSRAILIHEACHILDMKTTNGCGCDPYRIMYMYMFENGYLIEQIRVIYGFTYHDFSRKCKWKYRN